MTQNTIKLICFDAWGTLFHNTGKLHPFKRFNLLLGRSFDDFEYLLTFERHFALDRTGDLDAVLSAFLLEIGQEVSPAVFRQLRTCQEAASADAALYPEVEGVLSELRGEFQLALLSNCGISGARMLRSSFDLNKWFAECLFSYEIGFLKPSPEFFGAVSSRLSLEPADILVVGDHAESDYRGAIRAGMSALLVDRKGRHDSSGFCALRSLSGLPEAIREGHFGRE